MASKFDAQAFQASLGRLEALLQRVDRSADPAAQTRARELVQAVLDLHAAPLERLLEQMRAAGDAGTALLDACARDEVIAGLLLLHGLHPRGLEDRVRQALEQVRPYLCSHGGNVELRDVRGDVVRLRLQGSFHSCPSPVVTMQQTIEEAIHAKAPEVTAVEVEEVPADASVPAEGRARVALPLVQ
jgi:Fe-S cluster biogenesis protein NfuA